MKFSISVNNEKHKVDVEDDKPLLWVLREDLGMQGTKFGCGMAQCGACTVHVDGVSKRSCALKISDLGNGNVTTIEGIGSDEKLHPVQQAWLDHQVPQCGYCQPGQIMTGIALLDRLKGKMSNSDINDAFAGNICRCGTYPRIKKAMLELAKGN